MNAGIGNINGVNRAKTDHSGIPAIRPGRRIRSSGMAIAYPLEFNNIPNVNGCILRGKEVVSDLHYMCSPAGNIGAHTGKKTTGRAIRYGEGIGSPTGTYVCRLHRNVMAQSIAGYGGVNCYRLVDCYSERAPGQ